MRRQLNSLSDRLLGSLAPKATARAACPPPFYQYRCYRNGGLSGVYQRRYCIYIGGCLVSCGAWQTIGYCV
jgi:hypothetical protein